MAHPPYFDEMFRRASEVMARAYAPYSLFPVGCCIRSTSGALYDGCNVENASYPLGQCAEAGAIAAMVAAGEQAIEAVCVVTLADGATGPCGGCRQKISEFARPDSTVFSCGPEGLRRSYRMDELLPETFGPMHLRSGQTGDPHSKEGGPPGDCHAA